MNFFYISIFSFLLSRNFPKKAKKADKKKAPIRHLPPVRNHRTAQLVFPDNDLPIHGQRNVQIHVKRTHLLSTAASTVVLTDTLPQYYSTAVPQPRRNFPPLDKSWCEPAADFLRACTSSRTTSVLFCTVVNGLRCIYAYQAT